MYLKRRQPQVIFIEHLILLSSFSSIMEYEVRFENSNVCWVAS